MERDISLSGMGKDDTVKPLHPEKKNTSEMVNVQGMKAKDTV